MISHLSIPEFDRQFQRGVIERWYKAEGELVNFGEKLFDIRVSVFDRLQKFAGEESAGIEVRHSRSEEWTWTVRVVSSDYGVLRRVAIGAGGPCAIGDLVGVFSTRPDEGLDPGDRAPAEFRVTVSAVTDWE